MINTRQIYLAYRKLKGHSYYDNASLQLKYKIAEWESHLTSGHFDCNEKNFQYIFEKYTEEFKVFINNGSISDDFFTQYDISINFEIKKLEDAPTHPPRYITNNPNNNNLNILSCNYIVDLPIEFQLIGVLWLMFLNKYINPDIYQHNYANQIRKDTISDTNYTNDNTFGTQLSVNNIYWVGYRNWRDKALNKASEILDKHKNATIISLDIQRFYYSARIDLEAILAQSAQLGYLSNSYLNDEDFLRLTEFVIEINRICTNKTKALIYGESTAEFKNKETLLPVGFLPSGAIANLYLLEFDNKVSCLKNCEYYGRYVDDMLFVFSGVEDKRSKDPVSSFLKKHFINSNILTQHGNGYIISGFNNLQIREDKIVMEAFNANGSKAALNIYKKKLAERSSEYRFILDDNDTLDAFENSAYNLRFSESINKIRSIEAFKEDKLGASQYLARKISLASYVSATSGKHNRTCKEEQKQILNFFKGRNCITFNFLWEKVATLFILQGHIKSLNEFIRQVNIAINKVRISKNAVNHLDKNSIQQSLKNSLRMSISMAVAINPNIFDEISELKGNETWHIKVNELRTANLFRHHRIGLSCSNYTALIKDNHSNLFKGFNDISGISKWEPNITFWLSPRFVTLGEISSMCFKSAIENSDLKALSEIQTQAKTIFNKINYEWTSFYGGVNHKEVILYKHENCEGTIHPAETIIYDQHKCKKGEARCNKLIGLVNMQVMKDDWMLSLNSKSNISLKRKEKLCRIIKEAVRQEYKTDLLILPELATPVNWIDFLIAQCKEHQIGIITGLEYIITKNGVALNIAVAIIPIQIGRYFKDCIIIPRVKNHYAPKEKRMIQKHGLKIPNISPPSYDIIHWRNSYFSIYNCYELANIVDRSIMFGKVDFIVATELNADINYYSDVIGSLTRDLHCFVIQVNTSEYGDSRIMQPSDTTHSKKLFVKGGQNSIVMIDKIDIAELRTKQLEYIKNYNSTEVKELQPLAPLYIKQTPPRYPEEYIIKRIEDASL